QTETEATGAPQKHHYTLNQQVGSITQLRLITASIKITPAAPAPGIALLFSYQDLRPHECDNH
ncbi:hypothetical protein NXG88_05075, partial [Klebsiella pneumoniae]|uniref:hypothetical protein n=1 Tax=Klebsiella pneumoniae TaxID=573 RepID=UPI0023615CA4